MSLIARPCMFTGLSLCSKILNYIPVLYNHCIILYEAEKYNSMGQTDKTEQAERSTEGSLDDSLINLTGTIFIP